MRSTFFERATSLFEQALEHPEDERDAFVVAACAGDQTLLNRVRAMLRADAQASPLLDATPDNLAAAVAEPAPALEGRRFGPYIVREVIGRGGMGIVCLADREDVGKRVALKLVSGALGSPERVKRFFTERRLLAQLQHPNIVPLLDAGAAEDGTPWLAMEYVPGQSIDTFCQSHALSLERRLALFERVCGAVAYAHQHLIIHRDIKPSNVLVGADGEPRLLDFGIARLLADTGEPATGTAVNLLTPQYASPEQLHGGPISTASDIYQLGALLFQLLTGREPHADRRLPRAPRSTAATLPRPSQAVAGRPATGGVSSRRLAGDLDQIVLTATDPDPARRYRTVEQLSDDVRRHLDGRPILAQPPSAVYQLRKFVRRNVVGTSIAAIVMLALIAFSAAMALQNRRVEAQRVRADAVATLLTDIFAGADPTLAQGDTITVRGVLDRGAARVRANSAVAPEVKARLLDVIATAYANLGQTKNAIALETEAQALLSTSVPPGDAVRLSSLQRLSRWLSESGERQRALALVTDATRVARTLPPGRRAELADALNEEGFVRQAGGDAVGARANHEEALSILRSMGTTGIALEATLTNLGYLALGRDDLPVARALFSEVLGLRRNRLGVQHSLTAKSMTDIAEVLTRAGELEGAETLLRDAIAIQRRVYNAPHRDAIGALSAMAGILGRRGRQAAAESTQREVLSIARTLYGDSSTSVAMATANLAGYVQRQNRLDEAEALHAEAVRLLAVATGRRSAATAVAMTNLAWTLQLRRQSSQSEALYREALPVLDSAWKGTTKIAAPLTDFTFVLLSRDKCGDAVSPARRALAIASSDRPVTHADVQRPLQALGICLGRLGQLAEAESLLTVAYRALLGSVGPGSTYTIFAAGELAKVYERQGKRSLAADLRRKADRGSPKNP